MVEFNRHSFVKAISTMGFGALAATPVSAAMRMADIMRLGDRRFRVCETRQLMGTTVSITVIHESRDSARCAIAAAFAEMARLEGIFDRHKSSAAISVLNEMGHLNDAPLELVELIEMSKVLNRRADGIFDPTILPVLKALENGAAAGNPNDKNILKALDFVGVDMICIDDGKISFERNGMAMTVDGIGKGYCVDRAAEQLNAGGFPCHFINAGGDIRVGVKDDKGAPWLVALEHPTQSNSYPAIIPLKNAAVSTSGGNEKYFDASHPSHEINLRSAAESTDGVSFSVIAPTATEADAFSTAAFVMKPHSAIRFINRQKNCESLMVSSGGKKTFSRSWRNESDF